MRRAILGVVLAAALLGGWEWAAGPTVYHLPGAVAGVSVHIRDAPTAGPASRWLVLAQGGDGDQFWRHDHHAGRTDGPWRLPADADKSVLDPTGGVTLHSGGTHGQDDRPFVVRRLNPSTGESPVVWRRPVPVCAQVLRPDDRPPLVALAVRRPGGLLRVEVLDLHTGTTLRQFDHPARVGPTDGAAPTDWDISDDGTRLALCDEAGVELWDLAAGTPPRRLSVPDRRPIQVSVAHYGRTVSFEAEIVGRPEPHRDWDRRYWDWDTGRRLATTPGPTPPQPGAELATWNDGRVVWYTPPAGDGVDVCVTAVDGRPAGPWVRVPLTWAGNDSPPDRVDATLAPGTNGLVLRGGDAPPGWDGWARQLGLPPVEYGPRLTWMDGTTGRLRPLRRYTFAGPGGWASVVCQPGRLTALVADLNCKRTWLEVWPTPPRPAPPGWLWLVAPLAGGLAGRLVSRRPPSPRAGTASTGSS